MGRSVKVIVMMSGENYDISRTAIPNVRGIYNTNADMNDLKGAAIFLKAEYDPTV